MGSNNPHIHYVKDGALYRHDHTLVCRVGRRTGWLDWLKNPLNKSFSFTAENGATCTAVKQWARREGRAYYYWYAWRSIGGEKRRESLGKPTEITLDRLEWAAGRLAQLEFDLLEVVKPGRTGGKAAKVVSNQKPLFETIGFKQMSFLSLFSPARGPSGDSA